MMVDHQFAGFAISKIDNAIDEIFKRFFSSMFLSEVSVNLALEKAG
jgi:hypothetical protein